MTKHKKKTLKLLNGVDATLFDFSLLSFRKEKKIKKFRRSGGKEVSTQVSFFFPPFPFPFLFLGEKRTRKMKRVLKIATAAAVGVALSRTVSYFVLSKDIEEAEAEVKHHENIEKVSTNLWQVKGEMSLTPLFKWERNMTIFRTQKGELIIHNGISMQEEAMKELESLGTPSVLIVPNGSHRSDAMVYKERYPEIDVICPAAATEKVMETVPLDGHAEVYLKRFHIDSYYPPLSRNFAELVYHFPIYEEEFVSKEGESVVSLSQQPKPNEETREPLLPEKDKGEGEIERIPKQIGTGLLFCDLLVTMKPTSFGVKFLYWFSGLDPHSDSPQMSPMYTRAVSSKLQMSKWLKNLSNSSDDVVMLLFTHGPPITGSDCSSVLQKVIQTDEKELEEQRKHEERERKVEEREMEFQKEVEREKEEKEKKGRGM